jgi:hypothetical protein
MNRQTLLEIANALEKDNKQMAMTIAGRDHHSQRLGKSVGQ